MSDRALTIAWVVTFVVLFIFCAAPSIYCLGGNY
jgi:hypothetical protein